MSWVIVAVVGTAAVTSYMNSEAADSAADAQKDASDKANETQKYMYDQTRKDLSPYREAGSSAMSELSGNQFMKDWKGDPGFQFRMNEGRKALEGSAAARGSLNSGATLKALTRYGQDFASNEYGSAYGREFNRLSTLTNIGQNSAAQTGAAGQNYANAYGQNVTGAANAQAAAEMARAQGYSNVANAGILAMTYGAGGGGGAKPAAAPAGGGYGSAGGNYSNYSNIS